MKLLCKLGFHKWYYFLMSVDWYAAFEPTRYQSISRSCMRCDYMQCTKDGRTWKFRL